DPEGIFKRCFRHVVTADRSEARGDLGCRLPLPLQAPGNEVIAQDMPGGLRRFVIIKGVFTAGDFSPACQAAGFYAHEYDAPHRCPAETGLEKMYQRETNFAKLNASDPHSTPV